MSPRRLAALACLAAHTASAQPREVEVRLVYDAPEGCPSAADFQREVETRLERGRIAGSTELARTYRVSLAPSGEGARATLDFTDQDGSRASREVTGATCAEAASAMALIAALAIEARVSEDAQAPARAKPAPAQPPEPAQPAPAPAPRPPPAPAAEQRAVLGFGAAFGVEQSFAPKLAPAVAAIAELRHDQHALRAELHYADTGPVRIDSGSAELALYSLRLAACPVRLAPSSGLALVPCAGLEGGLVHAAGKQSERIRVPKSTTEPWLAAHAIGRVELSPDPGLAFGIEGALGFPFTRHEFVLEKPEVVVHEVPAVSWGASAGLVARFR